MKLCAVVIGSLTVRISVRKSVQAAGPARMVAAIESAASVTRLTNTARKRRVHNAHTIRSTGWSFTATPIAAATPKPIGCPRQRQPTANTRNRSGPTWPSFTAYTNGNDQPASSTSHQRTDRDAGRMATPTRKATTDRPIQIHVAVVGDSSPNGNNIGANVGG